MGVPSSAGELAIDRPGGACACVLASWWRLAGGLLGCLAASAAMLYAPVAQAAPGCRVEIVHKKGTSVFLDLQAAATAAAAGDRLVVRGICGGATLSKNLVITGRADPAFSTPTLDGGGHGSVLSIS